MPDTSQLLSHFYFTVGSATAPQQLIDDVLEITVESSVHLPDVATLTINDPRLHWVDVELLAVGTPLKVSAKVGRNEQPLFDGEIVEIEPDFGPATQRLLVRAFDRLHRLSRGRHVRSFQNVTDGDLVTTIARSVGLQAEVGPTAHVYPYLLQANETNLAFLQRRAATLGYLLYVDGTTLHCKAPSGDGPSIELKWGETLNEFRPRLTTLGQISEVVARGWDPANCREVIGQAREGRSGPQIGAGQNGSAMTSKAFGIQAPHLVADRPIRSQAVADQLAQSAADRLAGQFVQADGTCGGNPAIVAGAALNISAVGTRFGGSYLVTGATHRYSADHGYTTHFTISGLHPSTLLSQLRADQEVDVARSLVIGIVTDNQDPDGQGRVKVKYPWFSGEHASDWARVVVPGGGAERGIEFLPEVYDEVLVGFELGSIDHPYVLGGLWNGRDRPPLPNSDAVVGGKVRRRVIRSRAGHVITLDDSENGGGVAITDRNGNMVQFDSGANALRIEVKGDAHIHAKARLTLEAGSEVEIKGRRVTLNGDASVDVSAKTINLN